MCVCVLLTSVILRWSLVTELYSSIRCLISSLLNSVRSSLSFSTSWRTEEKGKHDTISHKSTEIIQQNSVCQDNVQENVDESMCKNSSHSTQYPTHICGGSFRLCCAVAPESAEVSFILNIDRMLCISLLSDFLPGSIYSVQPDAGSVCFRQNGPGVFSLQERSSWD